MYHKRKEEGRVKTIHDLPPREARRLRRKWGAEKRQQRKQAPQNRSVDTPEEPMLTPPATPFGQLLPHQKTASRKKLRREERRAYRTIKAQKDKIKTLQAELKKIRGKEKNYLNQLSKAGLASTTSRTGNAGIVSPATKATSVIETGDVNYIRKELTFGFALRHGIKESKGTGTAKIRKRAITCANKLLKKYRLIEKAKNDLGMSRRQLQTRTVTSFGLDEELKYKKAPNGIAKLVTDFFLRDDVSRPASGKKETKTLKKEKRQKRYQCDTLKT